jgi:hypothetical protein
MIILIVASAYSIFREATLHFAPCNPNTLQYREFDAQYCVTRIACRCVCSFWSWLPCERTSSKYTNDSRNRGVYNQGRGHFIPGAMPKVHVAEAAEREADKALMGGRHAIVEATEHERCIGADAEKSKEYLLFSLFLSMARRRCSPGRLPSSCQVRSRPRRVRLMDDSIMTLRSPSMTSYEV